MRLVSFDSGAGPRAALLREDRVYDIWGDAFRGVRAEDRTVEGILESGLLDEVEAVEHDGVPVADVELLPPLTRPSKIVCIGLNYRSHAEEQGVEPPETPTFFAKFRTSLGGARRDGRTAAVEPAGRLRGRGGVRDRRALQGRARGTGARLRRRLHAASTTSRRATTRSRRRSGCPARRSTAPRPAGPRSSPRTRPGPHDAIEIALHLNGEEMQRSSTADLVHSVPALVAYLSMLMTLEPGDVVATGTPGGVGSMRDPRVWLQAGDEVVVSSPQLGSLTTRLA